MKKTPEIRLATGDVVVALDPREKPRTLRVIRPALDKKTNRPVRGSWRMKNVVTGRETFLDEKNVKPAEWDGKAGYRLARAEEMP